MLIQLAWELLGCILELTYSVILQIVKLLYECMDKGKLVSCTEVTVQWHLNCTNTTSLVHHNKAVWNILNKSKNLS